MRNHSHCSRKRLAREGGFSSPNPGRKPAGAKNSAITPASSNIPSDWYPEKSRATLTNETKHKKQISSDARGHRFSVTSSDATNPTQHSVSNVPLPAPNHSKVGTVQ